MDDDIQDILDDVSAPPIPQRALDLQALTRAWVNERTSPELLPYPATLVERVMDQLKRQIETIEEMTGTMDPKSNFTLVVLQTELERFKFLTRSFVRTRIAKIDKFPVHTHQLASDNPEMLSHLERQYLQSHQALLNSHYHTSFLSAFPQNLQKMDDTAGGISMVDKPDEDTTVFCRVLRDSGTVNIYNADDIGEAELKRGDVWVLRWSAIKQRVERGDAELI